MIKTQRKVPSVYYNESRDFQLFGRIKDVIFNYIKNNTLAIKDITTSNTPNQKILELMCITLGFNPKHEYNNLELSALCSIFISCMKAKGSKKAVMLLLKMVCSIENSDFEPEIVTGYDDDDLIILLPPDVKDWTLIRDVLDYILPSGTSYTLRNQTEFKTDEVTDLVLINKATSDYSWNLVSSSIIKQREVANITIPGDDIVNYNVNMTTEGEATTGEINRSEINKDINSVDSKVLTLNKNIIDNEEIEQKRINKTLNEATTYEEPTTESNSEEDIENNQEGD